MPVFWSIFDYVRIIRYFKIFNQEIKQSKSVLT